MAIACNRSCVAGIHAIHGNKKGAEAPLVFEPASRRVDQWAKVRVMVIVFV